VSEEDQNKDDKQAAKDELELASINGIAYILTHLADHYGQLINDEAELNNVFLRVLSTLTGEMLAHYPEAERDDVLSAMVTDIQQIMDTVAVELEELSLLDEKEDEATGDDIQSLTDQILKGLPGDLTSMKPKGNC
jgi:hypothetical protein